LLNGLTHVRSGHAGNLSVLFAHLFFMRRMTLKSPAFLRNLVQFLLRKKAFVHEDTAQMFLVLLSYFVFGLIFTYLGFGLLGFALVLPAPMFIMFAYYAVLDDVNAYSYECRVDADYNEVQKNHNAYELAVAIKKVATSKVEADEEFYGVNFAPLFFMPSKVEAFERIKIIKKLAVNPVY